MSGREAFLLPENFPKDAPRLWTRPFTLLMLASLLVYANISIFFKYYNYLEQLPIDPHCYGLLMGVFSGVSLSLRPLISPWFNETNARRFMLLGSVLIIGALCAYSFAAGFWSMLAVRCLHGLGFVVMGSALMALLVPHIPLDRSAQAFGIMSVVVLLPNTMVPPLWPYLDRVFSGFTDVLLAFAGLTVMVFPVVCLMGPAGRAGDTAKVSVRLTWPEIKTNLRTGRILTLLGAMLALYSGESLVFFFLAGYAKHSSLGSVGFFFTVSTLSQIGVRLVAGKRFDRMDKTRLLTATLVVLAVCYGVLGHVTCRWWLMGLGVLLGLGWGICMPVFNSLMFDVSETRFRAYNANLGLQMLQGGYFIGPLIGSVIVEQMGFTLLFYFAGLLSMGGAGLCLNLLHSAKSGGLHARL